MDAVLGLGRALPDPRGLPAIGRITPHAGFLAMQSIGSLALSSRNIARRVFFLCCSKPVILARVLCFIPHTLTGLVVESRELKLSLPN